MNELTENSELVLLYLAESDQLVQKLEKIIMDADQNGELTEPAEFFRILHTLKGSSAMMDYTPLVDTAHRLENVLAVLKNTGYRLSKNELQTLVDTGISFVSYYQMELLRIRDGAVPGVNPSLNAAIDCLAAKIGDGRTTAAGIAPLSAAHGSGIEHRAGELCVRVKLKKCPMPHIRAFIVAKSIAKSCTFIATYPDHLEKNADYDELLSQEGFEIYFVPQIPEQTGELIQKLTLQPFVETCALMTDAQSAAQTVVETPAQTDDVRPMQNITVAQSVINQLMNSIGEIVLAENALEAYLDESGAENRRLQKLTTQLRRTVLGMNNLVSEIGTHNVGSVFIQMQRATRSMARELHKNIKVKTIGNEVQVDKSILEILSDSLIHIVRNAADHGIETPEKRLAGGKPETGLITFSASKKNGFLTVTVADDGAGINRKALLEKAERLQRLTKPKEEYTDTEVYKLLLSSGISTNANVTQYSGRGVGLDTVVRRVKLAGGAVSVDSTEGIGTVFTLRIPITLMLLDGIEVQLSGGEELIIPVNAIAHIQDCTRLEQRCRRQGGKNGIDYDGIEYSELCFPKQPLPSEQISHAYVLFFSADYGNYFIRAKKINEIATRYIKKLPEYVSDVLDRENIYSGCVLCRDSKLRCVLDVSKLIGLSEPGE